MHAKSITAHLTGLVLALAGCSPAEPPKPLTSEALQAALCPPAMSALRVQAAAIRHPLLAPVEIKGEELSPEELAVLAVLANPSLRAVRDQRGEATAQLLQAGLLPNPSLAWTNEFPYRGPDHIIAYNLGLSWEISALVSYRAKVAAARAKVASVDLDIAWQEWQIAQSAKSAAWKMLFLREQLAVALEAQKSLEENLQTMQKAVQLQLRTAVDLAEAEATYQESHTTVLELERDITKQRLALNRLLGLPYDVEVRLREKVSPLRVTIPPVAELARGLEDRRLDLLALRQGYESQEASLRAAVLSRFPKTSVGGSLARDTTGVYTAGYEFSMDLPLFDRNQGNIAIEKATRQRLFDEFVKRVYEGRNDIASSAADVESAARRLAFAQTTVGILERRVAGYARGLAQGVGDVPAYYTAIVDLEKKRIDVIKLRQEVVEAQVSLENASGLWLFGRPASVTSQPATQGTFR